MLPKGTQGCEVALSFMESCLCLLGISCLTPPTSGNISTAFQMMTTVTQAFIRDFT